MTPPLPVSLRYLALAFWSGLILFPSGMGRHALWFPHQDKLDHLLVFGLLALLARQAIKGWPAPERPHLWAWLYAALFGLMDEWRQAYMPHRTADPLDWLADILGAALFLFLAHRIIPRRWDDPPP